MRKGKLYVESVSTEAIKMLTDHVATPAELARRRRLFNLTRKIRNGQSGGCETRFASAEEMLRTDRAR